jgi:hypothetical protein
MEVCPLSRGRILRVRALPIHPITGWPSLFPSSSTRSSSGSPYGSLTLAGELRAYHVPHTRQNGLGSASSAGGFGVYDRRGFSPCTNHGAFWLKPVSTFGLFFLTTFNRSSPLLAIPFDPSSRTALMLAVAAMPHD